MARLAGRVLVWTVFNSLSYIGATIFKSHLGSLGLSRSKKLAVAFLLGALLGPAYDYVHVWYNVLTYATPHFGGTSFWVALEFGLAGVVGTVSAELLAKRIAPPQIKPRRLLLDAFLLLVAYFATGVFAGEELKIFLVLFALSLVSVLTRFHLFILVSSVTAAIVGPVVETLISMSGFFHYNFLTQNSFFTWVPAWLPLLWIIAAGLFLDYPLLLRS